MAANHETLHPVDAHGSAQGTPGGDSGFLRVLAVVATVTAMAMYVSYIPQISGNLNGHKSPWLQPLVAAVNCTLWVAYGLLKKPRRDLPVAIANFPGVVFGLIAFATAL